MFKVRVTIRLKHGVLDVQGKAVEHGLHHLGYGEVSNLRVGKIVEFELEARDAAEARAQAQVMCEKLLANTVIEQFDIEVA